LRAWEADPSAYSTNRSYVNGEQYEDAAVDGDIRVIDESGEDYLYPAEWFVPIELPQAVEKSLLRAA
jgi:hypothetical protein